MIYSNTQETSVYAAADLLPPLTSYRQLEGMIIVSAESCAKERESYCCLVIPLMVSGGRLAKH